MFSNNKISARQLQMLLILYAFGSSAVILPRRAAGYVLGDAWLVIIISTILALLYGFIITTLAYRFPGKSFFSLTSSILGIPIAWLICLGMSINMIVYLAMELRFFGEIVKQILLPDTPYIVVALAVTIAGAYAASWDCEINARIAGALVPIVLIPLAIVFGSGAIDVDFSNILPLFESNPASILSGGFFCTITFSGLTLILLANPFIKDHQRLKGSVLQVTGFIGVFVFFMTIVTVCELGPEDVSHRTWPIIDMAEAIKLPFSLIERQTALIMSFWIAAVFVIISVTLFFASALLKEMFSFSKSHSSAKKNQRHIFIGLCVLIAVTLSLIPNDISQTEYVMDILFTFFGSAYLIIIPLILLITSKIRGIGQ